MSTAQQSLALQQDALAGAGCGRTFTDVAPTARPSGAVEERDGLGSAAGAAALHYVRLPGVRPRARARAHPRWS